MRLAAVLLLLVLASGCSGEEIRGRVVDPETGEPVAGIGVRLDALGDLDEVASGDASPEEAIDELGRLVETMDERALHASTDEQGRFRFSARRHALYRVGPEAGDDWVVLPPRVKFVDLADEASRRQEIVFEARPKRVARAWLRLVERRSGAPVPELPVELVRSRTDAGERLVTDHEGRVISDADYAEGALGLRLLDWPNLTNEQMGMVRFPHEALEGREQTVEIDVGPVYRLLLQKPEALPLDELVAELAGQPGTAWTGSFEWAQASVRPGPRPWVRFAPGAPARVRPPDSGYVLEIRSRDGRWVGATRVQPLRARTAQLIPIELTERGALEGRVAESEGQALGGVRLRLAHEGVPPRHLETGAGGAYRFEGLKPGRYRLAVLSGRHFPEERTVTVRAGAAVTADVILRSFEGRGTVRVKLESASGRSFEQPFPRLILLTMHGPRRNWRPRPEGQARGQGATELTFVFDDVPPGEYSVRITDRTYWRWDPAEIRLLAPADDVVMRRRDDLPHADLGVRVYDAQTGAELAQYAMSWQGHTHGRAGSGLFPSGTVLVRDYPLDTPLDWAVTSPGYAPVFGGISDFRERSEGPRGPARLAAARLEPGWGARIEVKQLRTEAPLAGAEILLDGESVGRTDAAGRLLVYRKAKPTRAEAKLPGWTVVQGDISRHTGEIKGSGPVLELSMALD